MPTQLQLPAATQPQLPIPQPIPQAIWPTDSRPRFFLGVTTGRRPDWETYYSQPDLGGHLKEDTRAKKLVEKRQQQAEEAHRFAVGGYAQSIEVLDISGRSVLRFNTPADGSMFAAVQFVAAINNYPDMAFLLHDESAFTGPQVRWFGFDIREALQVIALDVMRYNALAVAKIELPVGMWYYRNFTPAPYLDPYETIVPTPQRANVDLQGLCTFLGLVMPLDLASNAMAKADLARRLCVRAQLFPVPEAFR